MDFFGEHCGRPDCLSRHLAMRGYASAMANCYAAWVITNIAMYTAIHPRPQIAADMTFAAVDETAAVARAVTLPILLRP